MVKTVIIKVDEKAIELIDKAAREEFSSRTNFMVRNSVKQAKEILENKS